MTKREEQITGDPILYETVYTYDLDRLTTIEEKEDGVTTSTKTLTYDGAGNLTDDGEFTYTWQMGRQLQGISGTNLATSYKYNENGLRTEKTVNGQKHEYTYLGSNVTREVIRDAQGAILLTIHYSYAGGNSPVSMNVNGTEYYYLKNAQGDVTHIVDVDGNEVASYEYDAWGNHLSVSGGEVAELNPYRYRGYRFDSETGLYYLQSRYYNPECGRFINADVIIGSGQLTNLFRYCSNNPINKVDYNGMFHMAITHDGGSSPIIKTYRERVSEEYLVVSGQYDDRTPISKWEDAKTAKKNAKAREESSYEVKWYATFAEHEGKAAAHFKNNSERASSGLVLLGAYLCRASPKVGLVIGGGGLAYIWWLDHTYIENDNELRIMWLGHILPIPLYKE